MAALTDGAPLSMAGLLVLLTLDARTGTAASRSYCTEQARPGCLIAGLRWYLLTRHEQPSGLSRLPVVTQHERGCIAIA